MKVITASRQCLKAVILDNLIDQVVELLNGMLCDRSVLGRCATIVRPAKDGWLSFLFMHLFVQIIEFVEVVRVLTVSTHRLINFVEAGFDLPGRELD